MTVIDQTKGAIADADVAQSDCGAVPQPNQQHTARIGGGEHGTVRTPRDEVTNTVRAAAKVEPKAAQEDTKRALAQAVRHAAVKAANDAATADLVKWASIAAGVVGTMMLIVGFGSYGQGRKSGRAVGENMAKRECSALVAASSWANTPEGELAFAAGRGFPRVARRGPAVVITSRLG